MNKIKGMGEKDEEMSDDEEINEDEEINNPRIVSTVCSTMLPFKQH